MKPWKTLASVDAPGGAKLVLQQRDTEFAIRVDGHALMNSRSSGSERAMAEAACTRLQNVRAPRVLVGGLGMGFTLRAALDVLPPDARVDVAELAPAIIEWNRGVLGPLAGAPLEDNRVTVIAKDVRRVLSHGPFDAILLDVDNGPTALTRDSNDSLYDLGGISQLRAALRPKGTLVVWSAGPDAAFVARLNRTGFSASARAVQRHTLFIATAD
jgi:spermidine synthase